MEAIYNPGQEVEVRVDGIWRPAEIISIDSYNIRETRRGVIQYNIEPDNVRGIHREGRPRERDLRINSQVEFTQGNRWISGIITNTNYAVNMGNGRERVASYTIRPRGLQQPAPQPLALPAGPAFEVHNAFADLNLPKFMTVVRRENNDASNFKDPSNVLEPVVSYINSSDTSLSQEQKTRYTRNIRDSIRQNVNAYITDHPQVKEDTLEVIQFVLSQDPKYKDLYIETFENECMGGYSSGNRQSCTKGMFERIYMANKGTIEGLCFEELQGTSGVASTNAAASSCKPAYLELYSAFVPGSDIDINNIFQKWYNQFSYDAIPEETNPLRNLSVEARKQHFRDFVRQDEAITQRIWGNAEFQRKLEQSIQANNIIFETLSLDAGLGKRRRKRHTFKHKKKHNRKTMKQRKATMKRLKRNVMKGKNKIIRKTRGRY